ncbi:MAG TPA: hypothetical protein VHS06_09980, partial [Chloroflexota bacterium]|nr:hypothetical protein [Chloroflexota bacterium]
SFLILSSRRKGDMVPGYRSRLLGSAPLQVAVYLFFVGAILAHGMVIWQDPLLKLAAFVSALLIVVMTVVVLRHGAMRSRAVVELRQEEGEESLKVTAIQAGEYSDACIALAGMRGQPITAVGYAVPTSGLLTLGISMPRWRAAELKVWAHRVKEDGNSEPLPASALLNSSRGAEEVDLRLTGGERLVELDTREWDLQVRVESGAQPFPARR